MSTDRHALGAMFLAPDLYLPEVAVVQAETTE